MPFSRPPLDLEVAAARPHVLIATGDPRLRARLAETFGADHFRVSVVEDGVALLERIDGPATFSPMDEDASRPDVVVADVELDGFTPLEILGMTDARSRPPTVLVASAIDVPLRLAARRLGATALLSSSELVSMRKVVRAAVRTRRRAPRAA